MPTHSETRELPYTAQQMYDLVADVASYPEFLPWTAAARIKSQEIVDDHEVMEADLVISFKVFRERFTSRVELWPATHKIDTEYLDSPVAARPPASLPSCSGHRRVRRGPPDQVRRLRFLGTRARM